MVVIVLITSSYLCCYSSHNNFSTKLTCSFLLTYSYIMYIWKDVKFADFSVSLLSAKFYVSIYKIQVIHILELWLPILSDKHTELFLQYSLSSYGTAQRQLDLHRYIIRVFLYCCTHPHLRVHACQSITVTGNDTGYSPPSSVLHAGLYGYTCSRRGTYI